MADGDAAADADVSNPNEASGYPGGDNQLPLPRKSGLKQTPNRSSNVRFDIASNTVAAYAPSDSSEEWDPNDDDEEPDPQAPTTIAGYLWKKSPSRMVLFKHQQRYFELKNCKLTWWYSEEEFKKGKKRSKGCIDFKATVVVLENDSSSSTRFELKPKAGKWNTGNFTGVRDGRTFFLDAQGSEQTREKWAEAISLHMNYANEQF